MTKHVPVLLHEAIDNLSLEKGDKFLDCTLGSGGHCAYVTEKFGSSVQILGLDRDPEAVERASERLRALGADFKAQVSNFRDLDKALSDWGVRGVDAILLDLGFSSDQMENSGRGFSFLRNEPLDMRMGSGSFTAADILNNWEEDSIELILRGFGEERYSKRIARAIIERRKQKLFETTFDLTEAINSVIPRRGKLNPATKTFQALRIAVNEELTSLGEALPKALSALNPGGRIAVISFHSLEDRIVKNFFKDARIEGATIVTKKPIVPTEEEIGSNPRSRSAKLRILEK